VDEKVRLTLIHRNSAISCTANRVSECIHPAGRWEQTGSICPSGAGLAAFLRPEQGWRKFSPHKL